MSLQDEVSLLRRVPLFASMEPARVKMLAFTGERLEFDPGEVLFEQGEEGDAAYVILSGQADVVVVNDGVEQVLARLSKNELVGEIALLCDVPRTATIRAATPLETLRIEKSQFLKLLAEFPNAATAVMRELAIRLTRTTQELILERQKSAG